MNRKYINGTVMLSLICSSFGEYLKELKSGRLVWSPLHTSAKFWQENAHRLMAKKSELLEYLV